MADASGWHSVHNSQEIFCLLVLPRGRFFHLTTHYFTGGWASSSVPTNTLCALRVVFMWPCCCRWQNKEDGWRILVARVFIMEIRLYKPQTGFLSSPPPPEEDNNDTGKKSEWDNLVNKTVFRDNSSERKSGGGVKEEECYFHQTLYLQTTFCDR